MKQRTLFLSAALGSLLTVHAVPVPDDQPNPPTQWLSNPTAGRSGVYVFDTAMAVTGSTGINAIVSQIYTINGGTTLPGAATADHGQFSDYRYALLFQPGTYDSELVVDVGYYTSVMGLGEDIGDTVLPMVRCQQSGSGPDSGGLNTFWRSVENFEMNPGLTANVWPGFPPGEGVTHGMLWANSQACPMRKLNIEGGLYLFDVEPAWDYEAGWVSGGFIADTTISGTVSAGGQQQYFMRNSDLQSGWTGAIWNVVFVGSTGAPETNCRAAYNPTASIPGVNVPAFTNVEATPKIAEKPYISYNGGLYSLNVPAVETDKIGTSEQNSTAVTTFDFSSVYVTSPLTDTAATINQQILSGHHILLSPGIYYLGGTIDVSQPNLCILGIGFPTLVAQTGQPCLKVTADNTRVGGILLQAGPQPTSCLLEWGSLGDSITEGFLYDCFARVGRFDVTDTTYNQVDTFIKINSSNIVCDNLWLWRADHDAIDSGFDISTGVSGGRNPCQHALIVGDPSNASYAEDTIIYGLAAEHALSDIIRWYGNNGKTYFLQCEYPYDVTSSYNSSVAYRVGQAPGMQSHQGFGLGVYSNFWLEGVMPFSGIAMPNSDQVTVVNALTRYLNNHGGIAHVVNDQGFAVSSGRTGPVFLCELDPASCAANVGNHRR